MNRAKNFINLIEDLWPASQPGFPPGISATTQLIPEQGVKDWRIQSKIGSVYGEFKGVTPTGALNAWAKTRGYESFNAMKKDGLVKNFEVMQGFRIIVEAKVSEDSWTKQAQEKARWAIEYGKTKGYDSIVQDGIAVLKMIKDGLDQGDILRSPAYATVIKVWGK